MKLTELKEARGSDYELYHDTMAGAIREVERKLSEQGYEMDQNDVWDNIATGKPKPQPGDTNSYHIRLIKDNAEQRQQVHFQVFNRDIDRNTFELNMYVS